jgi:hypothetical protein
MARAKAKTGRRCDRPVNPGSHLMCTLPRGHFGALFGVGHANVRGYHREVQQSRRSR